jgi:hypothetical protein
MNWLSTALSTVPGLLLGLWAVILARRAVAWAKFHNSRNLSLKRLTEIETEMTELSDSVASLHGSLKKLRSRAGMRELRAGQTNGQGAIPDAATDPTGYKRAMRLKLKSEGVIK